MGKAGLVTVRAIVRAVDKDIAWVEVDNTGCGRCHEPGGCGGRQIAQMFCSGPRQFQARCDHAVVIGQPVTVAVSQQTISASATLAYGFPLAGLLGGALLGSLAGEVGAMLGGGAGLLAAYGLMRQRLAGKTIDSPHIVSG